MAGGIAGIHYFEPGVEGIISTNEKAVFYGDARFVNQHKLQQSLIAGTARDLGNTPTTELRPGLVMAFNTTTNKWQHWVPSGMNGTGKVSGLLFAGIQTQHDGADRDRFVCAILIGGYWKTSGIIISNAANTTHGLDGSTNEAAFRTALAADMPWVRLDDEHEQA